MQSGQEKLASKITQFITEWLSTDGHQKRLFLFHRLEGVNTIIEKLTESELKERLKELTIIVDTREQQTHVMEYFEKQGIPYKRRALETGDYSAMLGNMTMERDVICERKHNLDELCQNFTSERLRFEREFLRAKAYGTKVFLIIENATWTDIFLGNYRSKTSPKSLMGSLLSWMVRFNVTVTFCKPEESARIIYGIFYYAARERLTYGNS